MSLPALQKEIYRVLKVTKCHKISQIIVSTRETEIISINFVVYIIDHCLKVCVGGGGGRQ